MGVLGCLMSKWEYLGNVKLNRAISTCNLEKAAPASKMTVLAQLVCPNKSHNLIILHITCWYIVACILYEIFNNCVIFAHNCVTLFRSGWPVDSIIWGVHWVRGKIG